MNTGKLLPKAELESLAKSAGLITTDDTITVLQHRPLERNRLVCLVRNTWPDEHPDVSRIGDRLVKIKTPHG